MDAILDFRMIDGMYDIAKYSSAKNFPTDILSPDTPLLSITVSEGEYTIVCAANHIPAGYNSIEKSWRAIKIDGKIDMSIAGILHSALGPLAEEGVSVFNVSSYDTDFLLIKDELFGNAIRILRERGCRVFT